MSGRADAAIAAAAAQLDSNDRVNAATREILTTIAPLSQEERAECMQRLADTIAAGEASAASDAPQLKPGDRPGLESLHDLR